MRQLPIPKPPGAKEDASIIGAHLKLGFDLIHGKLSDVESKLADMARAQQHAYVDIPGGVNGSASAQTAIDLLGPTIGQVWLVRSIVVGGSTPTTNAAGRADIHAAASNPLLTAWDLSTWRDQTASLPAIAFYGRGEFPLIQPQRLWVIFSSSAAIPYVARATIEILDIRERQTRKDE